MIDFVNMCLIDVVLFMCVMLMISVEKMSGLIIILIRCRNMLEMSEMYLVILVVVFLFGKFVKIM